MAAIETIPNAFWSALNNQNLNDLLPPRWSILVNDAGVQVNITDWVLWVGVWDFKPYKTINSSVPCIGKAVMPPRRVLHHLQTFIHRLNLH